MTKTKTKIIYLMNHPPAYEMYINEPRPEINWNTNNGTWVGIGGFDWGNQLGNAILKETHEFEFEVWQSDLRADKIYQHKFENGLVYKLFPAYNKRIYNQDFAISEKMLEDIAVESENKQIILQLGVSAHLFWIIKQCQHLPILGTFHGTISLPHQRIFKLRKNPLNYIYLINEHFKLKKILRHYDFITYQNDTNLYELKRIFRGPLQKVTMGTNFNLFRPMDKKQCRRELGLPLNKKVFLSVGRLNGLKQIDKLINVFINLKDQADFLLIIVGNPDKQVYLAYIKRKANKLLRINKILFTGYKTSKELVKYYNAADLFLMTSKSEAGPVVSMEAIACRTPVFTTNVGNTTEILSKYNAGCIVGNTNYSEWEENLNQFFSGKEITTLPRNIAADCYSWEKIAHKFISIYTSINKYYGH